MKRQLVRIVETVRGIPDDDLRLEKEINAVIREEAGFSKGMNRVLSVRTFADGDFYVTTILFEEN